MVAVTVVIGLPLVILVVALWLDGQPPPRAASYRPRAVIHDIERQTIQAMQRAEREARIDEAIDGTVSEGSER